MREIKFKGYWKNNEDIYLVVDPDYIDCGGKTYDRWDEMEEDKNYVLCQFTGIKDKNGKEIYEGDILELILIDYAGVPKDQFVVNSESFHADVCYLMSINREIINGLSENDSIEVIGSIYENPELVK